MANHQRALVALLQEKIAHFFGNRRQEPRLEWYFWRQLATLHKIKKRSAPKLLLLLSASELWHLTKNHPTEQGFGLRGSKGSLWPMHYLSFFFCVNVT
jgi:hypothetical protein